MRELAICLLVGVLSFSARAEDKSDGCGIANSVYDKKSLVGTTIRTTTNVMVSPMNLAATSSGTSGCSMHYLVKSEKRAIHFMNTNYQQVLTSLATGRGEHIQVLARLMGCPEAVTPSLGRELKLNFPELAGQTHSAAELLSSVKTFVSSSSLFSTCQRIVI